jgi:hypothetical protein
VTVPLHRVRNYEELDGGQGREVFFRPHRYRAADLLPLQAEVVLTLGAVDHSCVLLDISENGAAVEWPKELPVAVGDKLADVLVRFDAHDAYRGEARVGSVRDLSGVTVVGISFDGLLVSIEEILELRAIKAFAAQRGAPTPLWRVGGHERFKALVSELRLFFEDTERQLKTLENELPWHVIHGEPSPPREELIRSMRSSVGAETVRALEEIDQAVRAVPAAHVAPLREYARRHLHDYLLQAPAARRAYIKPFGYPGDYEVMRFLYERPFEGTTLFAKAMSLAVDDMAASRAVRCRKDLVRRRLEARLAARTGTLRVLAIASGPAQELVELLSQTEELPAPMEVVMFDQDKAALAYAYRRLQPLTDSRRGPQVNITYLNESIKRLLRDRALFDGFGQFDVIYSAGLFDYLRPATAIQLARDFYGRLQRGGELLIANMVPECPSRWYMEDHLDWHLLYRTRQDLLDIGAKADDGARMQVLEEESGVNPFLQMLRDG